MLRLPRLSKVLASAGMAALVAWASGQAQAAPLAGTAIINEASATYLDAAGAPMPAVVSNRVEAQVQQVAAFSLQATQSRLAAPGQWVYFAHTLQNTGNGPDRFDLRLTDSFAGGFALGTGVVLPDVDGDGLPDHATPITDTGTLTPGARFSFVVAAAVPGGAPVGQQDRLTLTAVGTATASPAPPQSNEDTAIVSTNAVLQLSKTLSLSQGPSPNNAGGAHIDVTLLVRNVGVATATAVRLLDTVGGAVASPTYNGAGFSYVRGSATLDGVALSDAAGGDASGVDYTALTNVTTTHMLAVLPPLLPGSQRRLSFKVDVAAGLPAGTALTQNIGRAEFHDGAAAQTVVSNTVAYEVQVSAANPDLRLRKTAMPTQFTAGFPGRYELLLSNAGNAPTQGTLSITDVLPTGMSWVSAGSGGAGWACGANGQTVTCNSNQVVAPGGQASVLTLQVNVAAALASAPQPVVNQARASGGGEPPSASADNVGSAGVTVGTPAAVAGRVWTDANHNRHFDAGETLLDGWTVEVLRLVNGNLVPVRATRSGPAGGHANAGEYRIDGLEPGAGYVVRFLDPTGAVLFGNPVDGEQGKPVSNATIGGGWLHNITLGPGQSTQEQSLPLDPSGVVYDAQTRQPVAGAVVTLRGPAGFDPATNLIGGVANQAQLTSVNGAYQFLLQPGSPSGVYRLEVVAPLGYLPFSPAGVIAAAPSLGPCPAAAPHCLDPSGRGDANGALAVQAQHGAPPNGQPTTYYLNFQLEAGDPNVVNNHIPVDPVPPSALFVQKQASRSTAELGDTVDFEIKVRNSTAATLAGALQVHDLLPAGWVYQPGSARFNGAAVADPAGGGGPLLRFGNLGTVGPNQVHSLSYRARIGVGAQLGANLNRVQALAGAVQSLQAQARVEVQGGVFSRKAYLLGKVYVDCNRDRVQNAEEIGIPGVRLYLEDGTFAISDAEGKYSFYGLSARTHVLKLDRSSLPVGSELLVLGNRNMGDAGSRFVDLQRGELHRANFAEGSCSPEVLRQVFARRDKGAVFVAETDHLLEARVAAGLKTAPAQDARAQPASGLLGGARQAPNFTSPNEEADRALRAPSPAVRPGPAQPAKLELLMPQLDNTLGFIDLKSGDTLPAAQVTVRVKGRLGSRIELKVNGEPVPAQRVGTQAEFAGTAVQAREYIGVDLRPGRNTLTLVQRDDFGNERGRQELELIAPGKLAQLKWRLTDRTAVADGHSPLRLTVELLDSSGVRVSTRTPLTLEASAGRWQDRDLDPVEPGVQVFVEGGLAHVTLLPPQEPVDATVRVSSGLMAAEERIAFLPDMRPLIGAGVIEGVLRLRDFSSRAFSPARATDGFEEELRSLSRQSADGRLRAAARAAFFLKGKVAGEYLLTLAYDSDKDTRERLLRDIQPDQFYPVYGDSAVKGFDAQSTSRLYVRIDHRKSYLLWGDFTTGADAAANASGMPARQLGATNRSLTGLKQHVENGALRANVYASRDSTRQMVEEIPARGISGPYLLGGRDIIANSERVEILTYDRSQPGVTLKQRALARFSDYDLEPATGRLLFKAAVPRLDVEYNPQAIRVTYEVEQGGQRHWVYGADGQIRLSEKIEVGASVARDENPQDRSTLASANATLRLAEKTAVTAEVAAMERAGSDVGKAARLELRHDGEALQVQAQIGKASASFANPASSLSRGREEASVKAKLKLDDQTTLRAEAVHSADAQSGSQRDGVLLSAERQMANGMKVELGLRHAEERGANGAAATEADSLRAKLSSPAWPVLGMPLKVFGEAEQDLRHSDRRMLAVGADWQLANRTRLYARHELISTLGSSFAFSEALRRDATVFGIDSDYMTDGHLFNEYRIRDAISGREAEAAVGLRNKWRIDDGVTLHTSAERIKALQGGAAQGESLALGLGADFVGSPLWKGHARLEYRDASLSRQWLATVGVASKLSRDWTFLGREQFSLIDNGTAGLLRANKLQFGLAYRDTDTDNVNALFRLENRQELDSTRLGLTTHSAINLLSAHGNWQWHKPLTLSARAAARWSQDTSNGLISRSQMAAAGVRAIYDIDWKWDASIHASVLLGGGGLQHGLGAELGYQLANNLWLSAGFNLLGYRQQDLSGADHTARGLYMRLRFKFDEQMLGSGEPATNPARGPRQADKGDAR